MHLLTVQIFQIASATFHVIKNVLLTALVTKNNIVREPFLKQVGPRSRLVS